MGVGLFKTLETVPVAAIATFLVFLLGRPLVGKLGPNTVGPMNRIFGFLILAVAVRLVWDGVADFRWAA